MFAIFAAAGIITFSLKDLFTVRHVVSAGDDITLHYWVN